MLSMKPSEILAELLKGRLLLVGEYRGSRAELTGYVDQAVLDVLRGGAMLRRGRLWIDGVRSVLRAPLSKPVTKPHPFVILALCQPKLNIRRSFAGKVFVGPCR